ncbi:MAG: hypothetical protein EBX37_13435 [Alphaproteobacteria bacterium]|nr:hypothetical protein [Alphaproteobacteria bacterium]
MYQEWIFLTVNPTYIMITVTRTTIMEHIMTQVIIVVAEMAEMARMERTVEMEETGEMVEMVSMV